MAAVAAWILGACAPALAALAVQQHRARRREHGCATEELAAAERRGTEALDALEGLHTELRHLTDVRMPASVTALAHPHVTVPGLHDARLTGSEVDRAGQRMLDCVGSAVHTERERVDAAARAALRGATTQIQAMSYRMQELLQELQRRYDGEKVMQDLIDVDFLNEQILRRIQVTGIVSDAWPGLSRADSYLSEIVIGASSRVRGYHRVQVSNQLRDPIAVVARAVEPVAVAVTELLANALHHSHPDLPVHVVVQQGSRGASVIVDDAGVGLHEDEARRATQLMTGTEPVLLTELGDPPRSGFAAIGQLCRAYGFRVHVETSAYGGVRAVVFIPGDPLLTLLDETQQPMSAIAPRPHEPLSVPAPASAPAASPTSAPAPTAPAPTAADSEPGAPTGSAAAPGTAALPRRRRRQPVRAVAEFTGGEPPSGEAAQTGAPTPAGEAAPAEDPTPAGETAPAPELPAPELPAPELPAPELPAPELPAPELPAPESPEEEAAQSAEKWAALQRGSAAGRRAALSDADSTEEGKPPA
ncbi:sensor histidine kinase [Streptomyces sp. NPDC004647]|uniref:sensor histidine kinase n=1 Tax=Streptomyces sp. NPDC004647 TaxID=3154671 RepID=UPI0033AD411D